MSLESVRFSYCLRVKCQRAVVPPRIGFYITLRDKLVFLFPVHHSKDDTFRINPLSARKRKSGIAVRVRFFFFFVRVFCQFPIWPPCWGWGLRRLALIELALKITHFFRLRVPASVSVIYPHLNWVRKISSPLVRRFPSLPCSSPLLRLPLTPDSCPLKSHSCVFVSTSGAAVFFFLYVTRLWIPRFIY